MAEPPKALQSSMSSTTLGATPAARPSVARTSVTSGAQDLVVSGKGGAPRRMFSESEIEKRYVEQFKTWCRFLADNVKFNVLTTVLTIYALFGDDFRLAFTSRPVDPLFDALTILCLLIFSFEIVVCCVGKAEYLFGFFFWLDLIATATLVADLTWLTAIVFCGSESTMASQGKAGRAGARAGRTVRVIRLMRLVKLYKMHIDQRERRRAAKLAQVLRASRASRMSNVMPGDEADDAELDDADTEEQANEFAAAQPKADDAPKSEMRVGKKLSDMTTQRVVMLVLAMLFGVPFFNVEEEFYNDMYPHSAEIGADLAYEKWEQWCPTAYMPNSSAEQLPKPWCFDLTDVAGSVPGPSNTTRHKLRYSYEELILIYIHTHKTAAYGGFVEGKGWELLWVGMRSPLAPSQAYLGRLAALTSTPYSQWDHLYNDPASNIVIGSLSEVVKARLASPWMERCMDFNGVSLVEDIDPEVCTVTEQLRCTEYKAFAPSNRGSFIDDNGFLVFYFDMRSMTNLAAALNMLQTIFICLAVGLGAAVFNHDANHLLLNPIERMMTKMAAIKDNPLEAMRLGDKEYRREEFEKTRRREHMQNQNPFLKVFWALTQTKQTKEPMETAILEKTIIKLGGLLALGFGEAGAEIIGQNMKSGDSSGVNPLVAGVKVDAIVGFCAIRDFTVATEVLKEKVMVFVNSIGEIVHGCVDDFFGAPNKNIGDSFLIVWRMIDQTPDKKQKLADMSIMSFVKIIANLNRSPVLAEYRSHPGLQQRIPHYRVHMGFGLHCGWAIEGAIGSMFKIDASYLSPNVNVAARLEAASSQFGTWLLMSHFLMALCSKELKAQCRQIDHVTVKGSKQPIRLFTIDLDYTRLAVQLPSKTKAVKNRFKARQVREARKIEKWSDEYNVWHAFETDEDVLLMRRAYCAEFFARFAMAYRNYEAGAWMVARDMLRTCHYDVDTRKKAHQPDSDAIKQSMEQIHGSAFGTRDPSSSTTAGRVHTNVPASCWMTEENELKDGPSRVLIAFMKQTDFVAPSNWSGYRELLNK